MTQPLGKTHEGQSYLHFFDATGTEKAVSHYAGILTLPFCKLPAAQVASLVAHLQAWLHTGSLELEVDEPPIDAADMVYYCNTAGCPKEAVGKSAGEHKCQDHIKYNGASA